MSNQHVQWVNGGGRIRACGETRPFLEAGFYTVNDDMMEIYLQKIDRVSDDLITLPGSLLENVELSIKEFWTKGDLFKEFGFVWKRGILLYGPPGCGKTSLISQIGNTHVEAGGVVLYADDPEYALAGLKSLREIEPDRPVLCILEDLEEILENHGESGVLSLLDGQAQIDKVAYIATTNYIKDLPSRIVNRPSRFDMVVKVPYPDQETRKRFLTSISKDLASDPGLLEAAARDSEGFSFAHLKELVISVYLFGVSFQEAGERLLKMTTQEFNEEDDEGGAPHFEMIEAVFGDLEP